MGGKRVQFDREELYKWIDNYTFSRHKRNINRDFSDAVPLAELLKQHYPKLVDLHNYASKNSMSQKLINWQTLNRKVLSKLNIPLSESDMQQLARSECGAIERVLVNVKEKIETKETSEKVMGDAYYVEGLSASISGSIIPVKQKDSKILNHKLIPLEEYTKMADELAEQREAINTLKDKVSHLENLLSIKDQRINDLSQQLEQTKSDSNTRSKKGSTFFQSIF